jgi:hypothetical protein
MSVGAMGHGTVGRVLTLILYRAAPSTKRIVRQLRWDGYDDGPLVLLIDGKNRSAVTASAACFEMLSCPPMTKTLASPITPAALAEAMAASREGVALVLGEAGLEATARLLADTAVRFDLGEAAILEIDQEDWGSALTKRAGNWKWQGTLTPSEGE